VTTPSRSHRSLAYDLVLGLAAGFSIGWFAWWAGGGISVSPKPFWPFAAAGIVGTFGLIRWARRQRSSARRLVHLLWIPFILFLLLMAAVVVALRNFE